MLSTSQIARWSPWYDSNPGPGIIPKGAGRGEWKAWVLVMSTLLLRDVESITAGPVVGSVFAVIGTILVSMW